MTEKKKPQKKPRPLPLPDSQQIDRERQQRNLQTIRELMGMNRKGLT